MTLMNRIRIQLLVGLVALGLGACVAADAQQAAATTRDMTPGNTWIERLERADRIPGLRIDAVIAGLGLRPGDVVADIGAGSGAYSIPFARAVAPSGKALAQDLWPDLMDYIADKASREGVTNLETVLGKGDDPMLPAGQVDVAFFHDVFHNVIDREAYLRVLAKALTPTGRIAIIEQEYDDPIAKKWDIDENRITPEMVDGWMNSIGFHKVDEIDIFQGDNNPKGAGMPERWFVVYAKSPL
jgi:SAM-dependent methyltransferase